MIASFVWDTKDEKGAEPTNASYKVNYKPKHTAIQYPVE